MKTPESINQKLNSITLQAAVGLFMFFLAFKTPVQSSWTITFTLISAVIGVCYLSITLRDILRLKYINGSERNKNEKFPINEQLSDDQK